MFIGVILNCFKSIFPLLFSLEKKVEEVKCKIQGLAKFSCLNCKGSVTTAEK